MKVNFSRIRCEETLKESTLYSFRLSSDISPNPKYPCSQLESLEFTVSLENFTERFRPLVEKTRRRDVLREALRACTFAKRLIRNFKAKSTAVRNEAIFLRNRNLTRPPLERIGVYPFFGLLNPTLPKLLNFKALPALLSSPERPVVRYPRYVIKG